MPLQITDTEREKELRSKSVNKSTVVKILAHPSSVQLVNEE